MRRVEWLVSGDLLALGVGVVVKGEVAELPDALADRAIAAKLGVEAKTKAAAVPVAKEN